MGQIQLEEVSKSFGDVEVIPPLDLHIEDGEIRRLRRAVGMRKVHAIAVDCRVGGRHFRQHQDRWQ